MNNVDEDGHFEPTLPQFMTVEEVAQWLKVSTMTIYRYLKDEKNPLPHIYLSDQTIRIPWEQFHIWLESKKEGGDKPNDR